MLDNDERELRDEGWAREERQESSLMIASGFLCNGTNPKAKCSGSFFFFFFFFFFFPGNIDIFSLQDQVLK